MLANFKLGNNPQSHISEKDPGCENLLHSSLGKTELLKNHTQSRVKQA